MFKTGLVTANGIPLGLVSNWKHGYFDEASEAAEAKIAADKAAKEKAAKEKADKEASDKAAGKNFTQDDLNKALAIQKLEFQKKTKETITELEALKSRADLTTTERDDLDARIETMKADSLTKEELDRQSKVKTDKEHETEVTDLKEKLERIETKYTSETITRSLTDASAEHDALVHEQIIAILTPKTKLEEEVDEDGNKTGVMIAMVDLDTINDEGQPKTLHLTASKAVEKMREISKYMNLFKIEGSSGIGQYHQSGPGSQSGQTDRKKLAKDPKAYREARAKEMAG